MRELFFYPIQRNQLFYMTIFGLYVVNLLQLFPLQ